MRLYRRNLKSHEPSQELVDLTRAIFLLGVYNFGYVPPIILLASATNHIRTISKSDKLYINTESKQVSTASLAMIPSRSVPLTKVVAKVVISDPCYPDWAIRGGFRLDMVFIDAHHPLLVLPLSILIRHHTLCAFTSSSGIMLHT